MMLLLTKLWRGFVWLLRMIATPVVKLRGSRKAGQVLRWTLHVLCVAAILVGLGFLNYALGLGQLLRVPWPFLRGIWLPLLFLLVYLLAWLGWWLWLLLGAEDEGSAFPDVDAAWNEGLAALEGAGVDLTRTPMFLTLGRPAGPESGLFRAADLSLSVPQTPRRADAPVHVCAGPEGIYVTCAGASLLGRQAALFAEHADESSWEDVPLSADEPRDAATDAESQPEAAPAGPSIPQSAGDASDGRQTLQEAVAVLVEEEKRAAEPQPATISRPLGTTGPRRRRRASFVTSAEEVELCTARLKHLCRLIARDRRPYCPVNGVLVLIPWQATHGELEADETAVLLERDLATVRDTLQVDCPLVAAVVDVERGLGAEELLSRFPDQQRKRRLGIEFPRTANCDAASMPAMIEEGTAWICRSLFPPLIYRLARAGRPERREEEADLAGNVQLYHFLQQVRRREKPLARILTRGINPDGRGGWRTRGLYLAATGPDATHQQGFVAGIFPQLVEMQNDVAWTPQALAEDAARRRWAVAGYGALAAAAALVVALGLRC